MSQQATSTGQKYASHGYDNYTIYEVMYLVGLSTDKMRSSSGGYYDCPVPACGKKGKFRITPSVGFGGVVRCNACNVGGDKVDLYILASGGYYSLRTVTSSSGNQYERPSEEDRNRAKQEIAEKLNLKRNDDGFISKNAAVKKQKEDAAQKVSDLSRSPKERDEVYNAFLNMLSLSNLHRNDLINRGLSADDIVRLGFRSAPTFGRDRYAQKLIEQGFNLEGIPGFFKHAEKNLGWSTYCPDSGFFIPYRDKDGYITFMEIRLNKPIIEGGKDKGRYRRFSSNRDGLECGSMAQGTLHVEMCEGTPRYVYVVEGALKAYVARALYNSIYGKDDIIFLAVPGVSSLSGVSQTLEWALTTYDIECVVEFYDLDKFIKPTVVKARNNLETIIKTCMAECRTKLAEKYASGAVKPPSFVSFPQKNYKGKGVDDHLLAIKKEMEESL